MILHFKESARVRTQGRKMLVKLLSKYIYTDYQLIDNMPVKLQLPFAQIYTKKL